MGADENATCRMSVKRACSLHDAAMPRPVIPAATRGDLNPAFTIDAARQRRNDEPDRSRVWWTLQRGEGPVLATAIHDGHALRPTVAARMRLADRERLREEDPFTGLVIQDVPTHIVPTLSRFEVDLNRATSEAIYQRADQAWGLELWRDPLSAAEIEDSLAYHKAFYAMLGDLLDDILLRHRRFLLLDVHSYNHRRDGRDAAPMAQRDAPDVNIGTFSMPRREWAWLVDPLIDAIADFDFAGRRLDVRENVAFQGKGELARFVHARHPGAGCALAFEFKKFYMDEWSGEPHVTEIAAMRALLSHLTRVATELIDG